MRLNRVLLLAATVNILIFALVFTISCSSGEDGKNGKNGTACIVDDDWNIVCDGREVGKLEGTAGADGQPGRPGKDGKGCWLGPKTDNGSYEILCGTEDNSESKGMLVGCNARDLGPFEIELTCGMTKVNMCKGIVFDPEESNCTTAGAIVAGPKTPELCGKVEYDPTKQYCGYSEKDSLNVTEVPPYPTTIYDLCGTKSGGYVKPNLAKWDEEYCRFIDSTHAVVAMPRTNTSDLCDKLPLNKDKWKGEYCGYKSNAALKKTILTGICDQKGNSIKTTMNDCIAFEQAANSLTLVQATTKCATEEFQGPNEKAFGQGYCEVKDADKLTGKTTYSEKTCGASGRINKDKWSNEYCGFTNVKSAAPDKIYKPLCDEAATAVSYYSNGSAGYFAKLSANDIFVNYNKGPSLLKIKNNEGTQDSLLVKDYCAWQENGKTILTTVCGENAKPNGGNKWNKDYCGFKSDKVPVAGTSNTTFHPHQDSLIALYTAGLCDIGGGPFSRDRLSSSPGAAYPANVDSKWNGYCQGNAINAKTTLVAPTDTCGDGKKKNLGKWNKEYCGWAAGATVAFNGSAPASTDLIDANNAPTSKQQNDACEDGTGPRDGLVNPNPISGGADLKAALNSSKDNYCAIVNTVAGKIVPSKKTTAVSACTDGTKPNDKTWKGEYCGVRDAGGTTSTKGLCGDGNGPRLTALNITNKAYCQQASEGASGTVLASTATGANGSTGAGGYCGDISVPTSLKTVNADYWKNEYCYSDKKVNTCPGGRPGITTAKSTDPVNERCNLSGTTGGPGGGPAPTLPSCVTGTAPSLVASSCTQPECTDPNNYLSWTGGTCVFTAKGNCEAKHNGFTYNLDATCTKSATSPELSAELCAVGTLDITSVIGTCKYDEDITASFAITGPCEAGGGSWGLDPTAGTCSKSTLLTESACEAASVNTWTPPAAGAGTCSNSALTSQSACETPKGVWTPDPTAGTCSNSALTSQSACETPKGVWTPDNTDVCNGGTGADQTDCEAGGGTWGPDATAGSCSITSITAQTPCEAANVNTWTPDATAGSCSITSITAQTPCEAANVNTWTPAPGTCSDAAFSTQPLCEAEKETWTPDLTAGICTGGSYTGTTNPSACTTTGGGFSDGTLCWKEKTEAGKDKAYCDTKSDYLGATGLLENYTSGMCTYP